MGGLLEIDLGDYELPRWWFEEYEVDAETAYDPPCAHETPVGAFGAGSATERGWGPGWPNCQTSKVTTLVRADGLRLPVRTETIYLVAMLCDLTELLGYDLVPGWCWCFACRTIAGTNVPSNHSWALALDLNAPNNPYASAAWHAANATPGAPFGLRIKTDIPERIVRLWEGHGYFWGGRYGSKPDPMHFENMETPAQVAATTQRLWDFLHPDEEDNMPSLAEIQGMVHSEIVASEKRMRAERLAERNSVVATIRRVAGVPLIESSPEQHLADKATGAKIQAVLNG